jgi:hypothetical protein
LSSIAGNPQLSVRRSCVEDSFAQGRFGNRTTTSFFIYGDLGRNFADVGSLFHGPKNVVASGVVDLRIVVAEDERCLPIETIFLALCRTGANETLLTGPQVASTHRAILAFSIKLIGIGRID